jgi:nucleoside-diphosphate-sugar epimerase
MHWLITGGAGFIGTNAARILSKAGDKCSLVDNFHRQGARYNREYLSDQFGLVVDYSCSKGAADQYVIDYHRITV